MILSTILMLFTRLHAHMEGWSRTNEYCQNLLHFLCQSTLRVWATLTSVWLSLIFHPALVATERFLIKGLPKDPQVKRTGPLGTKLEFSYVPGQAGTNAKPLRMGFRNGVQWTRPLYQRRFSEAIVQGRVRWHE
jgi:hypothetical protein